MVADWNIRSKSRQSQSTNSSHYFIASDIDRAFLRALQAPKDWRRSWALRALLQPVHALLAGNDRDSSRNKPDRVLPVLRDHASALFIADRRMGVRRTRQDFSHILHLDARRRVSPTRWYTRNGILSRNHGHGFGRKQLCREPVYRPFPGKAGSRRRHVFRTLRQDRTVWPSRMAALCLL